MNWLKNFQSMPLFQRVAPVFCIALDIFISVHYYHTGNSDAGRAWIIITFLTIALLISQIQMTGFIRLIERANQFLQRRFTDGTHGLDVPVANTDLAQTHGPLDDGSNG